MKLKKQIQFKRAKQKKQPEKRPSLPKQPDQLRAQINKWALPVTLALLLGLAGFLLFVRPQLKNNSSHSEVVADAQTQAAADRAISKISLTAEVSALQGVVKNYNLALSNIQSQETTITSLGSVDKIDFHAGGALVDVYNLLYNLVARTYADDNNQLRGPGPIYLINSLDIKDSGADVSILIPTQPKSISQ